MPDLVDFEALITRLAARNFSKTSEQDTREVAVNPIIGALGWDTFDPDEVAREYSVRGGKIDYCLRGPRGPLVLIEVKRTGSELGDHQEQLLGYAFREGVPLAALTDGLVWWLYLPTAAGSWERRRFYRINFHDQDTADAASAMRRFLNREGLVGGTALDEARREFEGQERDRRVRATLREAWRQVLCDPESLLPELLAEKVKEVSGYLPDPETVTEFLHGVSGNGSTEHEPPPASPSRSKDYRVPEQHKPAQPVPTSTKGKESTIKMSTRVEDSQLLVQFAGGARELWGLPNRSDKAAIRRVRDAAVTFARHKGATPGQVNAVKKALTDAGYYLMRPKDEIAQFAESVGADLLQGQAIFRRPNYFRRNDRILIVKISRLMKPFWGVQKKVIDEVSDSNYMVVLLTSSKDGWLFFEEEVRQNIAEDRWRLASDDNYKINTPLPDQNAFCSIEQFLQKIEYQPVRRHDDHQGTRQGDCERREPCQRVEQNNADQ